MRKWLKLAPKKCNCSIFLFKKKEITYTDTSQWKNYFQCLRTYFFSASHRRLLLKQIAQITKLWDFIFFELGTSHHIRFIFVSLSESLMYVCMCVFPNHKKPHYFNPHYHMCDYVPASLSSLTPLLPSLLKDWLICIHYDIWFMTPSFPSHPESILYFNLI